MRWRTSLAIAIFAAAAGSLVAQQTATTTSQTTTTTKTTTVSGEVVQYEPGKTIVLRDSSNKTTTYSLDAGLAVPAEVQVGRRVTVYSSPVDGSLRVQRITTTQSTSPDGNSSTSTEVKDEPGYTFGVGSNPPAQADMPNQNQGTEGAQSSRTTTTTTTKTTRVYGTVQAYQPGQSITIVGPGSKTTTYTITTDSQLPSDVAVGKVVTIETSTVSGKPVARTVTYKTTTKTTTKSQ
jgi:hypothetical protein